MSPEPDHRLRSIHIEGFKSIREAEVELRPLNVLIGENGSGKSNFVEVFRLLHALSDESFQTYVHRQGPENLLFLGSDTGESIHLRVEFPPNAYAAILTSRQGEDFYVRSDQVEFLSDR